MALKITTAANNRPVLWLYGVIGAQYGGISADEFRQALDSIPSKQEVEVRIHSEGGSYMDSIAMHSNLARRTGKVTTVVDGLAASGGSVVAMAGGRIEMAEGSWMMIHEAHGGMEGGADEFREAAARLDATNSELVRIYSKRWKGGEKTLRAALSAETWLTSAQAVEAGLADIVTSTMALAAHVDPAKFEYVNVPQPLLEAKTEETPHFPRLELARPVLESLLVEPKPES